ncbi:Uncharacterised protein [Enterobacter hormaechei]|nr:Uncharacterised protein [Enterobacter hormaechei]
MAQRRNGFDFFYRRVLQYQLRQRTKCHFFTVVEMVRIRHRRHAIVNGVCRRQPATFEAHAAQIGVGFNNAFQSRRHHVLFRRQHRFLALFNQRVVAQLSQR